MKKLINDHNRASSTHRIAFVGDSITWGGGLLDSGFVGDADSYIREHWSVMADHSKLSYEGKRRTVKNPKFFGGSAAQLYGVGSEVSFHWTSDELNLIQAIERTNDSASLIEIIVDGKPLDAFSNYNDQPTGMRTINYLADGETEQFDLGCAFTYGHKICINGVALKGGLNMAGYGGAIPPSDDYLVIRKYAINQATALSEVHHFVDFRETPSPGARIEITYSYGESITYAKTTVGEIETAIDSPLESRFGEGDVAFDPAHPTSISSGLDFRLSDERAIHTWKFSGAAPRKITLRIIGFDRRGGQTGSPYLIVNAVTDRFHQVMNAGIGGWTARLFNQDTALRNGGIVALWKPDIVFIGLGTNDDWGIGNEFVASRVVTGWTEEKVRRSPTLFLKSCAYEAKDSYKVETAELLISDLSETRLTFDGLNVTFGEVKSGDILVIGDYYGDNRNVLFRIVHDWDPVTRTVSFEEPLTVTPLTKTLRGFIGQSVLIKRIDGFMEELNQLITTIRHDPSIQIALIETGLSNFYTRILTGYSAKIKQLANELDLTHVGVYQKLMEWQYSQAHDLSLCAEPVNQAASGEAGRVYKLTSASGKNVGQLRNYSVLVDGSERYGDNCHFEGGLAQTFHPDIEAEELIFDNWNGRARTNPKITYHFIPMQLVFTANVPQPHSSIEVSVSASKWSADDAHLNLPGGIAVYAQEVISALERMAPLKQASFSKTE